MEQIKFDGQKYIVKVGNQTYVAHTLDDLAQLLVLKLNEIIVVLNKIYEKKSD